MAEDYPSETEHSYVLLYLWLYGDMLQNYWLASTVGYFFPTLIGYFRPTFIWLILPDANRIYQLDLMTDYDELKRENSLQGAMLDVRQKYGANAVFRGTNLTKGATALERNLQIGGHRA